MTIMNLSDEQLISQALNLWANHIETGTVTMSAVDASAAEQPYNALTLEQMKTVVRLRELAITFSGA